MRKKLLILVGLLALMAPIGCSTSEPTMWSWSHHKRRLRTLMDDMHQVHMDFDRIVFDMEPYPVEIDH